ncbi:hypothetical protein [Filomicrobium sp.]|uniref:hypothetical protein n=1 Tax=Filomicrobium sp. TaxID=2024831 RepID=UPI0025875ADC|nr:hypothetical protein [Filomicrobium sp.]MCV0369678.1 hypothetical protein [Filomicrobium sp.]
MERLAVWVAARRYAGGDIHHYWQQRRKAGIKLLPLLRHHALQLKGVLEEVREARLLSSVEDKLDELDSWIDDFERIETTLEDITVRRGALGRPQDKDLVFIIADIWREVTGEPPPIDRSGRFHRFLRVFLVVLPSDAEPRHLPDETIKDWLTQYRRSRQAGGI